MTISNARLVYTGAEGKEKARMAGHPGGMREKKIKLSSEARRRLRAQCHSRSVGRFAAPRRSGPRCDDRIRLACRKRQVFPFTNEREAILLFVPVDANQVAKVNLFGGQQVGQGIDHVAFDGALQVPCAIPLVGAFLKKELTARRSHAEKELAFGGFQNTLLHLP